MREVAIPLALQEEGGREKRSRRAPRLSKAREEIGAIRRCDSSVTGTRVKAGRAGRLRKSNGHDEFMCISSPSRDDRFSHLLRVGASRALSSREKRRNVYHDEGDRPTAERAFEIRGIRASIIETTMTSDYHINRRRD